jgi:hypothetical protein
LVKEEEEEEKEEEEKEEEKEEEEAGTHTQVAHPLPQNKYPLSGYQANICEWQERG